MTDELDDFRSYTLLQVVEYWEKMPPHLLTAYLEQLYAKPDILRCWGSTPAAFHLCKPHLSRVHYDRLMQIVTTYFQDKDCHYGEPVVAVSMLFVATGQAVSSTALLACPRSTE